MKLLLDEDEFHAYKKAYRDEASFCVNHRPEIAPDFPCLVESILYLDPQLAEWIVEHRFVTEKDCLPLLDHLGYRKSYSQD